MSEKGQNEKEEKEEKEEKSWDEKWRRDPLSAAVWACILIWAGLAFLIENFGLLDRFETVGAWDLIFVGAGLLVLGEALIRFLVPTFRRPIVGTIIFGVVLLAIGLGDIVSWGIVWAIALIAIGLSMLLRAFLSRD